MSNVQCKHCNTPVVPETEHHCREMQRLGIPPTTVPKSTADDDGGCFITSAVIASATDSAIIGTILGGDPVGAAVGDALTEKPSDEATSRRDEDTDTSDERNEEGQAEDEEAGDDDDDGDDDADDDDDD